MVDYKGVLGSVLLGVLEVIRKAVSPVNTTLITSENSPEVIEAVAEEMKSIKADLVLARLQDLEKAVYHIAGKQQELMEQQKSMEEIAVSTATSVDEILNGLEEAVNEEFEGAEDDDDLESSLWEGKKASTPLN
jgi:CRISPR/Cas system-associated exonuclease Cas4 (RecB family)